MPRRRTRRRRPTSLESQAAPRTRWSWSHRSRCRSFRPRQRCPLARTPTPGLGSSQLPRSPPSTPARQARTSAPRRLQLRGRRNHGAAERRSGKRVGKLGRERTIFRRSGHDQLRRGWCCIRCLASDSPGAAGRGASGLIVRGLGDRAVV